MPIIGFATSSSENIHTMGQYLYSTYIWTMMCICRLYFVREVILANHRIFLVIFSFKTYEICRAAINQMNPATIWHSQ
jgi:hypothetical protein